MNQLHHIVILGGGFGGLYAAQTLCNAAVRVTLIDRRNFHLFQPLLYQVATGGLSPGDISTPLRHILKRKKNVRVVMGEALDIDVANQRVILHDGEISYDSLLVATGVSHSYFGNEQWEKYAPGLKTVEDAVEMRRRILMAFETAERVQDCRERCPWLNFVVVGGGPTGVELAGALSELAKDTMKEDFRQINPAKAEIILIEGADRVLPSYPADLSLAAHHSLERLGVRILTNTMVTAVDADSVTIRSQDRETQISAKTVLWAAGIQASPLGNILSEKTGACLDHIGRIAVEPDLSLPGHPELLVIGDLALFQHGTEQPLPGVAPVAMQQGRYAADSILCRLRGETAPPFRYKNRGSMAVIGRAAAVADLKRFHLTGFLAWLAWLFIHLIHIVEFENRVLVTIQWAWNYFTKNRGARLITGISQPAGKDVYQ
ncbi:MAG: NAD(P)/FAD-dependent oxidoreductase [Candidatus Omnitrophota bacterium]|jgi:NADH dehydrogenase|nr:MAG: NAD(P)/FAD-dependent oxidoreductase [Candidatus Omnitrophota bacterium]